VRFLTFLRRWDAQNGGVSVTTSPTVFTAPPLPLTPDPQGPLTRLVGERLLAWRVQRGLSKAAAARQADVSVTTLEHAESGHPSLETSVALARVYRVPVQALLGDPDRTVPGTAGLPKGLAEVLRHPDLGAGVTPDLLRALIRTEHRGQRPTSFGDWYSVLRLLHEFTQDE